MNGYILCCIYRPVAGPFWLLKDIGCHFPSVSCLSQCFEQYEGVDTCDSGDNRYAYQIQCGETDL